MVKLFQSFQKWLPLMVGYDILAKSGIKASNSMQRYACQLTHQAGYFTFFVGLSLAIGFLTCEATKLQEYSDNFYIFSSLLLNAFFYISIKYKTDTIINLVKRFERIVDERKWNYFFFLKFYSNRAWNLFTLNNILFPIELIFIHFYINYFFPRFNYSNEAWNVCDGMWICRKNSGFCVSG